MRQILKELQKSTAKAANIIFLRILKPAQSRMRPILKELQKSTAKAANIIFLPFLKELHQGA